MKMRAFLLAGTVLPLCFPSAGAAVRPILPDASSVIFVQSGNEDRVTAQGIYEQARRAARQARRALRQAEQGQGDRVLAQESFDRAEQEVRAARAALVQIVAGEAENLIEQEAIREEQAAQALAAQGVAADQATVEQAAGTGRGQDSAPAEEQAAQAAQEQQAAAQAAQEQQAAALAAQEQAAAQAAQEQAAAQAAQEQAAAQAAQEQAAAQAAQDQQAADQAAQAQAALEQQAAAQAAQEQAAALAAQEQAAALAAQEQAAALAAQEQQAAQAAQEQAAAQAAPEQQAVPEQAVPEEQLTREQRRARRLEREAADAEAAQAPAATEQPADQQAASEQPAVQAPAAPSGTAEQALPEEQLTREQRRARRLERQAAGEAEVNAQSDPAVTTAAEQPVTLDGLRDRRKQRREARERGAAEAGRGDITLNNTIQNNNMATQQQRAVQQRQATQPQAVQPGLQPGAVEQPARDRADLRRPRDGGEQAVTADELQDRRQARREARRRRAGDQGGANITLNNIIQNDNQVVQEQQSVQQQAAIQERAPEEDASVRNPLRPPRDLRDLRLQNSADRRQERLGRRLRASEGELRAAEEELRATRQRLRNARLREDDEIIRRDDDGLIVRREGQIIILREEAEDRFGKAAQVEQLADGFTRTVVLRGEIQIATIHNQEGTLVRRSRILPDGQEMVLIDAGRAPVQNEVNVEVNLPPLQIDIPREEYIVETDEATGEEIEIALSAPPVEKVERVYTLEEVRQNERVRAKVRRIDLDTITFEFGSYLIAEEELITLEEVGIAIEDILFENPNEVFLVEGHTDAVGSNVANLALSGKRAESVAIALSKSFDIPPENLVTQGYGEEDLKVLTEAAARENRRVTLRRITALVNATTPASQQ